MGGLLDIVNGDGSAQTQDQSDGSYLGSHLQKHAPPTSQGGGPQSGGMPQAGGGDDGGLLKSIFSRTPQRRETGKPLYDIYYMGQGPTIQVPRYQLSFWEMQNLAFIAAPYRHSIEHLANEFMRNGGEWKPKYEKKCAYCDENYDFVPMVDFGGGEEEACENCETPGTLVDPDESNIEYAKWLFNHANNQETVDTSAQSIYDVFFELSYDLDIFDNAFLILVKEYYWDQDRQQVMYKVKEIMRGHPLVMRIVADDRGARGGRFLSCPLHRDYVLEITPHSTGTGVSNTQYVGHAVGNARTLREGEEPPKYCPVCMDEGRRVELRQVWYVATEMGGNRPTSYFFADEVKHQKKHNRGMLYGVPPILTLYRETRAYVKQVEYIQEYFERRRIPRGAILVRRAGGVPAMQTPGPEDEIDAFKEDINRKADDDPHDIPFIAVNGDDVQFQPFADTIREMDYIALRQELRNIIGAYFGISPIFQGDMSVGQGLNNEGLQITVTNRAVESHQRIFNEEIIPFILGELGITEWEFRLRPHEEKDLAHTVQLKLLKDQHAMNRKNLGFDVKINEYDEYEFSHEPKDPMEEMMGEMGGGGGGGGGPSPSPGGGGEDEPDTGELAEGMESSTEAQDTEGNFQGDPGDEAENEKSKKGIPYRGPRGGTGVIDPETGRVDYGSEKADEVLRKSLIHRIQSKDYMSLTEDRVPWR